MKFLLILMLIIWLMSSQANDNDRRPSWSQGLPEKKATPEINKPDFKIDTIEIERTSIETNIVKPQIGYSKQINVTNSQQEQVTQEAQIESPEKNNKKSRQLSEVDLLVQQKSQVQSHSNIEAPEQSGFADEEPSDSMNSKEAVVSSPRTQLNARELTAIAKQSKQIYGWEIIRQFPIEVSSMLYDKQSSVLLKIFIDAKGDVIAVEPVLNEIPDSLVIQAQRSIKRWKFVPPQSMGFKQQVLSRVFKVALSKKN